MMRLKTTWAMVLAAGCFVSSHAQIAPLDRAKEAAAHATAASRGTPEQQQAINQSESRPAAPPSQAVAPGPATISPARGGAAPKTVVAKAPPAKATPAKAAPAKTASAKTAAKNQNAAASSKEASAEAKPASAPEMAKARGPEKRRDPFVSPVVRALATTTAGAGCSSTGKRCLNIGDMNFRGVVRSPGGMIAVVENGSHRTYFLRERDEIFSGVIEKITGDSIIIRETTVDGVGHSTSREVVKKLNPAA